MHNIRFNDYDEHRRKLVSYFLEFFTMHITTHLKKKSLQRKYMPWSTSCTPLGFTSTTNSSLFHHVQHDPTTRNIFAFPPNTLVHSSLPNYPTLFPATIGGATLIPIPPPSAPSRDLKIPSRCGKDLHAPCLPHLVLTMWHPLCWGDKVWMRQTFCWAILSSQLHGVSTPLLTPTLTHLSLVKSNGKPSGWLTTQWYEHRTFQVQVIHTPFTLLVHPVLSSPL